MMNKAYSIYIRLLKLLILAMAVAVIAFMVMDMAGVSLLDYYFTHSDYAEKQNKKRIDSLQEYILKNHVNAVDDAELTKWVKEQSVVSIQIYRKGILIYDSNYPDEEAIKETGSGRDFYDWETYYTLQFEDGSAEVVLYGMYDFQIYWYATIAELFISFLLFLGIVMLGIRKTMKYIRTLSREIDILEGGNLDYSITVSGNDELAMLAESLNQMRKSFKAQVEQDAYLTQANRKMITEMSHDLRTPLTSMMIYTEILRNGKYTDERQLLEYLDRIDKKAHQMKQLTENIFEYSLISSETDIPLDEPAALKEVFYDVLSEAVIYLEQNGFKSHLECEWGKGMIRINSGYLTRIMDNILSNIIKYADAAEPVEICVTCTEEEGVIRFTNKKSECGKKEDSNQIGLRSIQGMIKKMGGVSNTMEERDYFSVSLRFQYYIKC